MSRVIASCIDCGTKLTGHDKPVRCRSCAAKCCHANNPERNAVYATDEFKTKIGKLAKDRWADPDYKARTSKALKAASSNPEVRAKQHRATKEAWNRGCYDNRVINLSPSSLEVRLAQALDKAGILYIQQYKPDGYWRYYDFYLPGHKLLIEVDGAYWHSLPGRSDIDVEKTRYAIDHGYMLLRVPDDALERAMKMFPAVLGMGSKLP